MVTTAVTEQLRYGYTETELGTALVASSDKGVRAIVLRGDEMKAIRELGHIAPSADLIEDQSAVREIVGCVSAFMLSPRRGLEFKLDLRGDSLQLAVWEALVAIPVGETRSYGALAKALALPATAQEVGAACAANVIALAVPCHRVLKADGSVSGYRWGVNRKRRLLEKEYLSCQF